MTTPAPNETGIPPSQSEMDAALNPDVLSGAQIRALKKLDEKNVDTEDLEQAILGALATYEAISDGVESSAGTVPAPNSATG